MTKEDTTLYESLLTTVMTNSTESIGISAVEGDGIYRLVYLNNTNLIHINRLGKTNYTAKDLIGKTHEELFLSIFKTTKEEFEQDNEKRREAIESKTRVYYDEVYMVDNDKLCLESCVTPVFNEVGICTHTLWSARDVTERKIVEEEKGELLKETLVLNEELKASEEELIEINRELVNQNEQLNQFSQIVSHNLRGPVSSLLAISNSLSSPDNTEEHKEELIKFIQKSTNHLDGIIKDLNTVLAQTREMVQAPSLVYFEEEVSIINDLYRMQIEKEGAQFAVDFSKAPSVVAIKSFVHSILTNLISNSLKYKKQDAPVKITITSSVEGDHTVIQHTDNGIGMDMNLVRNRIFGFYKRFHTHREGKGIGLYLVKSQVELMGGRIEVESKVMEGTTFTVYFKNAK